MGQGDKEEDFASDARGVIAYGLEEGTTTLKRILVDANGNLFVRDHARSILTGQVVFSDEANTSPRFYAFRNNFGGWIIMKIIKAAGVSTMTFQQGVEAADLLVTEWGTRAGNTYVDYKDLTF